MTDKEMLAYAIKGIKRELLDAMALVDRLKQVLSELNAIDEFNIIIEELEKIEVEE